MREGGVWTDAVRQVDAGGGPRPALGAANDDAGFVPHPLLRAGEAQTLAGLCWPRPWPPGGERLLIPCPPGYLTARWHHAAAGRGPRGLTVVLLHGLGGSSASPYVRGAARKLLDAGLDVVRLNLRGCGDSATLSPTVYHAGSSDDVAVALRHLRTLGCGRLALWGFSLGGNLALKLAGEAGASAERPAGVVALSPLTDLSASAAALDQKAARVYRAAFLADFTLRMWRQRAHYRARYDVDLLPRLRTIADFHQHFVAPACGFRDADDYHERASAAASLSRLRTPTLVIHAQDDPVVPMPAAVIAALQRNPAARLLLTRQGGHLGFVGERRSDEDPLWAENRAVDFLTALARC